MKIYEHLTIKFSNLENVQTVLKKFKNLVYQNNCFLAGGVKSKRDIKKLRYFGFKGVLVSNMIHKELVGANNSPPII